jgi:diguanylate cyclase (GGDEF)-like protein/PAS domain S-box-containing protein
VITNHIYTSTLQSAVEHSPGPIIITDPNGVIQYVNNAFTLSTGYEKDEVIGKNPKILNSNKHSPGFYKNLWQTIKSGKTWTGTFINKHKSGYLIYEDTTIIPIFTPQGEIVNYISLKSNITKNIEQEEKIKYLIDYDELTGLPNRYSFMRILSGIISNFGKQNNVYIAFVDLDNFKDINDLFGHDYGDMIIKKTAEIIKNVIGDRGGLYRMGGDEFGIIFWNVESPIIINGIFTEILNQFRQSQNLDNGLAFYITASIGATCWPIDGNTTSELVRNADLALYNAKKNGRDRYAFWIQKLSNDVKTKKQIENLLRNALLFNADEQLELCYQPQINMKTGKVCGAEALIRWHSPDLGAINPGMFIPIAEETGVIMPLSVWILEQAFTQIKKWHDANEIDFRVYINIPGIMYKKQTLPRIINELITKTNVNPHWMGFEITETTLVGKFDEAVDLTTYFHDLGIKISIDDFGTGYSNMKLLSKLPVDKIKIDKSFVDNIKGKNPNLIDEEMALPKTVIQLGHNFGMEVVAEGVETDIQHNLLQKIGCEVGQGWLWCKALPPDEFINFVKQHKSFDQISEPY